MLELWAEGYGERINKGQIIIPRRHKEISLQGTETTVFGSESSYILNKQSKVRLGEVGAGEDSQVFGDSIDCSNQIFDLTGSNMHGITSLGLNKVTFQLKKREKYKGREAYSIEITSSDGDKQLNWANSFTPIVI
ncbi:hypothetical protein WEN_02985 [Mycoplasma wenyonii str. Massachusetts]|uniref:Uncharacterized protein n=1 Tax=Mycoplasma wenyonii (strain Massachusetts) TaxID=1197325 RepID=I6ZJK4_MYCWM|nr:hypothetical protein [Mycoplasma wenyonii]AFN65380.1 hypothetical protein WEN_02985 [Mycoplasma wenyonii str. Massachusetts]